MLWVWVSQQWQDRPPTEGTRITEDEDVRITEDGDTRITEDG